MVHLLDENTKMPLASSWQRLFCSSAHLFLGLVLMDKAVDLGTGESLGESVLSCMALSESVTALSEVAGSSSTMTGLCLLCLRALLPLLVSSVWAVL